MARGNFVWSKERIERDLKRFATNAKRFPLKAEFAAAGEGPLYTAVMRNGGKVYWATRLGIPIAVGGIDDR